MTDGQDISNDRFQRPLWGLLVAAIGVLVILLARKIGGDVKFPNVLAEVGVVILTVGVVEMALIHMLSRIANHETETDILLKRLLKSSANLDDLVRKIEGDAEKAQIIVIQSVLRDLQISIKAIHWETKQIRAKVDPQFAKILKLAEEQNNAGNDSAISSEQHSRSRQQPENEL